MLQQEPAAGLQVGGRRGDQAANQVEAVAAGRQGVKRLETQIALAEMRIGGGDVGGVAGDEVEAARAQGVIAIAGEAFDVGAQRAGVGARHVQGGRADVDRGHPAGWPLQRQADRDRAAADTDLENVAGRAWRQAFQGLFH